MFYSAAQANLQSSETCCTVAPWLHFTLLCALAKGLAAKPILKDIRRKIHTFFKIYLEAETTKKTEKAMYVPK